MKYVDRKMQYKWRELEIAGLEFAGLENAGLENAGQKTENAEMNHKTNQLV